jgi:hypothetical protein
LPSVEEGVVPDVVGIGAGDAEKLLSQAGYETSIKYAPIPGVAAGIVDSMTPPAETTAAPGSIVLLRVSGTDVPLDGYLTPLACSQLDMMPFAVPANWGPSVSFDEWIHSSVPGVQPDDTIEVVALDPSSGDVLGRAVVRGRDELAFIVGNDTGVEGVACRGSGIGGV